MDRKLLRDVINGSHPDCAGDLYRYCSDRADQQERYGHGHVKAK